MSDAGFDSSKREKFKRDPKGPAYDFDCISCGACCTTKNARDHLIYITREDFKRLPPSFAKKNTLIFPPNKDALVIGALRSRKVDDTIRCCALKGPLGKKAVCKIYPKRPDVCRACEMGSEVCLDSRRSHGMSTEPASA